MSRGTDLNSEGIPSPNSPPTSTINNDTQSPFVANAHQRQSSQDFPQDDAEEFGSISPGNQPARNVSYALAEDDDGTTAAARVSGPSGNTTNMDNKTKKLRFGTIKKKLDLDSNVEGLGRRLSKKFPVLKPLIDIDNGPEISTDSRVLYVNQPLPEDLLDPKTHMPKKNYPRNKIRTSKYTPLSFVPKNLFFQFHNVANIYFLFIVILSAFEIFGVQNPGLSAVPIIAIVIITAIKDAIEDYRRTILDGELNNTLTTRLTGYSNPNVVEGNISLWRRIKKASTRTSKKLIFGTVHLFSKKSKSKKSSSQQLVQPANLELHSVVSHSTYQTQTSVYNDELPGSELPSVRQIPSNVPLHTSSTNVSSNTRNTDNKSSSAAADFGTVIDRTHDVPGSAKFKREFWKNIKCGDIVKIFDNEEVPSDVVVLSTSDADGACFIETRNLDGETNLKVRQSLRSTGNIKRSRDLEQSVFQVECEPPSLALYSFNGVLKWEQRKNVNSLVSDYEQRTEPITINNLLLRGSSLRNTKWVIGLVVYTGAESKIMLNAGATPAKRSRMSRSLNINVLFNFIFLFVLAFLAGVLEGVYYRKDDSSATFFEFGSIGGSAPVDGLVTFWAAVILLQNLIPISLYISIEIVKTIQAFFIYSDLGMYYEAIDYPCTPKSWSISDDVGQVEYIFSDKTGTLTQNVMEFRKCTIAGVSYGKAFTEAMLGLLKRSQSDQEAEAIAEKARQEVSDDKKEMIYELRSRLYDNPYLFDEDVAFVSSQVVKDLVGDSGKDQQRAVQEFFLSMALCHTVLPDKVGDREQKLIFKAQSPDEAALVATAKDLGYSFVEKTRNGVVVDIQGTKQTFQVLCILEFNSTRKRMSAIIRMPDNRIMLFCKGADSVIYERLTPGAQQEMRAKTAEHLEEFAKEGLRTLCLAEKEISPAEYAEWSKRHDEAASAIYNRDEKLDAVAEEIEKNLMLIGGTAIEDRLQDGVPDAISLLGRAGIKVWVLTGDKVETAINIGFSCNLLENGMELLILNGATRDEVDVQLSNYLSENFPGLTGSDEDIEKAKKDHSPPSDGYGLVIDGDCLKIIIADESLCKKFVILGKQCKSVLCCRVSPSQKAAVVSMVKNTLDVTTLSIGDGANDVAMILEADVGVGIAGLEGRQAAMSSDYAIGQFRFLKRLVLVHGRWSYYRVAEMTANLFFKNVVFTLTLFWYDVHNSFDGSYLFDYTYITLFNLAFTSLPVIFMGVLDQDVSDEVSLKVPQLYRKGILRQYWTQFKFWVYIIDGVYQSAVCYFMAFCVFYNGTFVNMNGLQINEVKSYGVFVATAAIAACNFYVMMNQMRWDWLFLLLVAISTLLVFFWTGIYTQFTASGFFYKNASQVYSSVPFWACTLLQIVVCILPRLTCKAYQKIFMPYDVDIVREYQAVHKSVDVNLEPEENESEKPTEKSSNEGPVFGDDAQLRNVDTNTSWRDSLRRLSTSGGVRLSVDLPEMTTANHLMQRMESNS